MNASPTLLKDSLLLIWNNRNAAERLHIMEKIYAPGITFFESDNSHPFTGFESINTLIEKLQQDWPADFEFTLLEPVKVNYNIQYISWELGVPGQQPVAKGSDIAVIEDNKIKALYLLLDI